MSRTKRADSGSDSGQSTHPKKSPTIPPQTFPLAHPPPKSKSKSQRQCLRLSSRLLLQIQQLHYSSTSLQAAPRAIPILELYQPSTFGKSVGTRKAHSRDMYLVQSEPFVHLRRRTGKSAAQHGEPGVNGNGAVAGTKPRSGSGSSRRKSKSSQGHESSGEDEDRERRGRFKRRTKDKDPEKDKEGAGEEEEDVVAVIHTTPKPKSKSTDSPIEAELYFPLSGSIWDATSPSPGHYRFKQDLEGNGLAGDDGVGVVFSWENRPPSASSTATEQSDEGDRFVLSVSGGRTTTSSRRPWLAQLTRKGLHVGGMDAWHRELRALAIDDGADGAGLYTLIVTMGVWVARREGWVS